MIALYLQVEVGATAARLRALVAQTAAGAVDTRVTPDIQQLAVLLGVPMGEVVEAAAKALVQGVAGGYGVHAGCCSCLP
jgi:hypothetical protein